MLMMEQGNFDNESLDGCYMYSKCIQRIADKTEIESRVSSIVLNSENRLLNITYECTGQHSSSM